MAQDPGFPLRVIETQDLGRDKITITYRIRGDRDEAMAQGHLIAHEHTVELPDDVLNDYLRSDVVGTIEAVQEVGDCFDITLCYSSALASDSVPALLGLMLGNASFFSGVQLIDLTLPPSMASVVPGPRHGVAGIRSLLGAPKRPLCGSALKPLGASVSELAGIAGILARGRIDIIKDDDGLGNQPTATWLERVRACSAAVREANARVNGTTIYAPNITGPLDHLAERALKAQHLGAGAVEIIPGLVGYDALRMIVQLPGFDLPIIAHSAWSGALMRAADAAIHPSLVLGTFPRLFGADISAMPGFVGRFGVSETEAIAIAAHLRRPGPARSALAMPGGGLTFQNMQNTLNVYGPDTVLLMSTALFQYPGGLLEGCLKLSEFATLPRTV